MFGGIASRYDATNHLLSGGMDFWWRNKLVKLVKKHNPSKVVDLATGSGNVAFALKSQLGETAEIQGLDFCKPMLDEAEKKRLNKKPVPEIEFASGDILNLPLENDSVDAMTVAFGIRNLENRDLGFSQIKSKLRSTGSLFILEFSQPYSWIRPIYYIYLKYMLPTIAGWITRKPEAYDYLGCTIEEFPAREALSVELKEAGFKEIKAIPMTLGIVSIHQAIAP
ncbi:MAG: ubiquinone biosynthesis protein [Opitutaceae bacterium]|nr:ubiquinone biosynthesis protein [Opitutaceae bacterium]